MSKYFIIYNNLTNLDINIDVIERPPKPAPMMNYEEIIVPGGKTLYVEKGYSDIEIPVSFNFISKNSWDFDFRRIKNWLLNKVDNKLKFSDDLDFFYKVNKVTIDTPEREINILGRFDVTFTCDPYTYVEFEEIELSTLLFNEYLESKPLYRIVGDGQITLNVNGKQVKFDVGQELIVDTDKELCYRQNAISNVSMLGRYEDMYLVPGENKFSWTNGFKIYILPNMRCL